MKKIISIVAAMLIAVSLLSGCDKAETVNSTNSTSTSNTTSTDSTSTTTDTVETIKVVTTIFPEYDWVREVVNGNDNVDVTLLLDKGIDLHSFQPSADDIVKVASADVFIYVGGESDGWVEDALAEATNKNMVVINLLDVLGDSIKEEELVEGMQGEEEEEDEDEEEGPEYDEHVWLSLKAASNLSVYIANKMSEVDPANKDLYEKNVKAYVEKLDELDNEYAQAVANATKKTVLFGDRFPFRYLVDDYNLEYFAAFVGCSAESEASFETITFLAGKVDELGLSAILQIESANGEIAETIKNATADKNQEILTLDSMQSVTAKDVANGETYLGIMQQNLDVLKQALK